MNSNKKKPNWFVLLSLILIALIIVGLPLLVDFQSPKTQSEITADGFLGYAIGALGFVATLILSALALWQTQHNQKENDKAQQEMKELNDRMFEIEENNYKIKLRPFVNISSYSISYYGKNDIDDNSLWIVTDDTNVSSAGKYPALVLSLVNTTDSIISLSYNEAESSDVQWLTQYLNLKRLNLTLLPAESKNVIFFAGQDKLLGMEGKTIRLSFFLDNRFAQRYKESFDLYFNYINRIDNKWHFTIFSQNFSLIKFSKDEKGEIIEIKEEL